jgi:hypothetical protein
LWQHVLVLLDHLQASIQRYELQSVHIMYYVILYYLQSIHNKSNWKLYKLYILKVVKKLCNGIKLYWSGWKYTVYKLLAYGYLNNLNKLGRYCDKHVHVHVGCGVVFLLRLHNKINHLHMEKLQWPHQKYICWTVSKNKVPSTIVWYINIHMNRSLVHSTLQLTCVCVQPDTYTPNMWLIDPLP